MKKLNRLNKYKKKLLKFFMKCKILFAKYVLSDFVVTGNYKIESPTIFMGGG